METDVLVCLTATKKWYGKVIRKLTHSNVNHAFLAYRDPVFGYWNAIQTDERGVVVIPAEKVKCDYIECYKFKEADLSTSFPWAKKMVGNRYDWMGVFGFLIVLLIWRMFGRRIGNPLHKKGELFCSEFVTRMLQMTDGMDFQVRAMDPSVIAPGGDPAYLRSPSLQWELNRIETVEMVYCPWPINN